MNFAVTGLGGKYVSNFHLFTLSSVFLNLSMVKYQKKGIYFFFLIKCCNMLLGNNGVGGKGSLQKLQKLSDLVVDGFCNIFMALALDQVALAQ